MPKTCRSTDSPAAAATAVNSFANTTIRSTGAAGGLGASTDHI